MGDYSVPEDIRKMKPKGTMVKKINNGFYVYKYSTEKVQITAADGSTRRKSRTHMGECIGRITKSEGFIPNDHRLVDDKITAMEYGGYAVVLEKATKTLEKLKENFNLDDAIQIYSIAVIFFVEGFSYIKNIKDIYTFSFLSLAHPNIKLGYDAIHNLYKNLGARHERVRRLFQSMVDESSKRIAVDGHVIACTSECCDLSEYGYKSSKIGTEQINWLTAYDVVTKTPLLSHVFSGANPDKTTFDALFDQYDFANTEFLVDRGFNTSGDKTLMSQNGNTYIVPMISGRQDYARVISQLRFDKRRYFVFNKAGYASMVYYMEIASTDDSARYIAYRDMARAEAERQSYIRNISDRKRGFSEQGLLENADYYGLFMLETNSKNLSPEEVFCHYKERWSIETYYNYVRNNADFNALYQQDYFCMEGLSFLVTVSGMVYHEIKQVADKARIPVRDIMNTVGKLKISLEKGNWIVQNKTKKVRELCNKIDFNIPEYIEIW